MKICYGCGRGIPKDYYYGEIGNCPKITCVACSPECLCKAVVREIYVEQRSQKGERVLQKQLYCEDISLKVEPKDPEVQEG